MPQFKIVKQDLVSFVEVQLTNESVRTESGAMRYHRGNIEMKTEMPSLGKLMKSTLTGEKIFRPVYSGTGLLVLEPSFGEFYELKLSNDEYVLDRGAYWASDMALEVGIKMNKLSTGLLSGEGMIQSTIKGSGSVIIHAPGPIQIIDLKNERLVVDGSFAVARSAKLTFSVSTATRSLFGTMASSEFIVQVLEGTGRVYLAPIPNHTKMLQEVITGSFFGALSSLQKK